MHKAGGQENAAAISQEAYDALLHEMGLDLPVPVRYWNWLTAFLRGDMGASVQQGPHPSKTRIHLLLTKLAGYAPQRLCIWETDNCIIQLSFFRRCLMQSRIRCFQSPGAVEFLSPRFLADNLPRIADV